MDSKVSPPGLLMNFLCFKGCTFEALCVELGYSTGKINRSFSIYRPPDILSCLAAPQLTQNFFDYYSTLVGSLSDQHFETYILMDSNIDLL